MVEGYGKNPGTKTKANPCQIMLNFKLKNAK